MQGLYYSKDQGETPKFHFLRFYQNQYVIYKSITGDNPDYLTKELKSFAIDGMMVKAQPEYTFCGAYQTDGTTLKFAVENEIFDPSDSWVQKDILRFKGKVISESELELSQVSERTKIEATRRYFKVSDEEFIKHCNPAKLTPHLSD